MGKNNTIVFFSDVSWSVDWSSRKRVAIGLAEQGRRVVYFSGLLSLWQRHTADWKNAPLLSRSAKFEGVEVVSPGRIYSTWPKLPWWNHVLARYETRLLKRILGNDRSVTAVANHPRFLGSIRSLDPTNIVYYLFDAYNLSPGWNSGLASDEKLLASRADEVCAFSEEMTEHIQDIVAGKLHVIPTGVDYGQFAHEGQVIAPDDLAHISSPRIGYVGRINQKIDFSLIHHLCAQRPKFSWVFVGPMLSGGLGDEDRDYWERCLAMENFHYLGAKAHSEVGLYLCNMDVNIMCYKTSGGWWEKGYPLKVHEYLAAGLPVVSADLKSIAGLEDVLAIAKTRSNWIAEIDEAVSAGGVGTKQARREVARQNSWARRAERLDEVIP